MSKVKLPKNVELEIARQINAIHILSIVQEGLIMSVEQSLIDYGAFKYEYKKHVKTIKDKSGEMRAIIHKVDPVNSLDYGDDSELIENFINELIKIK